MAQSVARGSPTAGLPAWISPQLAQLVDAAPGGDPMAPRDQIRRLPHACGAPAIEQPALFQVLNEKRKLAQRRHRRPLARLPFRVNPARKTCRRSPTVPCRTPLMVVHPLGASRLPLDP